MALFTSWGRGVVSFLCETYKKEFMWNHHWNTVTYPSDHWKTLGFQKNLKQGFSNCGLWPSGDSKQLGGGGGGSHSTVVEQGESERGCHLLHLILSWVDLPLVWCRSRGWSSLHEERHWPDMWMKTKTEKGVKRSREEWEIRVTEPKNETWSYAKVSKLILPVTKHGFQFEFCFLFN